MPNKFLDMLKIASKTMSKKGVKYKRKTNEFFFFFITFFIGSWGWVNRQMLFVHFGH